MTRSAVHDHAVDPQERAKMPVANAATALGACPVPDDVGRRRDPGVRHGSQCAGK
jgi:hypothetical protein